MSGQEKGPHLSERQVEEMLTELGRADGASGRALTARLAWRPAWAIRSRKGAWRAFLALFHGDRST